MMALVTLHRLVALVRRAPCRARTPKPSVMALWARLTSAPPTCNWGFSGQTTMPDCIRPLSAQVTSAVSRGEPPVCGRVGGSPGPASARGSRRGKSDASSSLIVHWGRLPPLMTTAAGAAAVRPPRPRTRRRRYRSGRSASCRGSGSATPRLVCGPVAPGRDHDLAVPLLLARQVVHAVPECAGLVNLHRHRRPSRRRLQQPLVELAVVEHDRACVPCYPVGRYRPPRTLSCAGLVRPMVSRSRGRRGCAARGDRQRVDRGAGREQRMRVGVARDRARRVIDGVVVLQGAEQGFGRPVGAEPVAQPVGVRRVHVRLFAAEEVRALRLHGGLAVILEPCARPRRAAAVDDRAVQPRAALAGLEQRGAVRCGGRASPPA